MNCYKCKPPRGGFNAPDLIRHEVDFHGAPKPTDLMTPIFLWWSAKLAIDRKVQVCEFMQGMINRLIQGQARYGDPKKEQKYHQRLELEVKAYMKTGNAEQLYNIANYCVLEMMAPGHPKHHLDTSVESVTREKV